MDFFFSFSLISQTIHGSWLGDSYLWVCEICCTLIELNGTVRPGKAGAVISASSVLFYSCFSYFTVSSWWVQSLLTRPLAQAEILQTSAQCSYSQMSFYDCLCPQHSPLAPLQFCFRIVRSARRSTRPARLPSPRWRGLRAPPPSPPPTRWAPPPPPPWGKELSVSVTGELPRQPPLKLCCRRRRWTQLLVSKLKVYYWFYRSALDLPRALSLFV